MLLDHDPEAERGGFFVEEEGAEPAAPAEPAIAAEAIGNLEQIVEYLLNRNADDTDAE